MKQRFTLLAIFMSIFYYSYSQTLHHTYHDRAIDVSHVLVKGHGGQWIVGGATGTFQGWPNFLPYLMAVDDEGQIVWDSYFASVGPTEIGLVSDIIYDEAAAVYYVSVYESGCDYGLPSYIHQLDTEGNINWTVENESFYHFDNMEVMLGLGILGQAPYSAVLSLINDEGVLIKEHNFYDEYGLFAQDVATMGYGKAVVIGTDVLLITDWLPQEVEITASFEVEEGLEVELIPSNQNIAVLCRETLYLLNQELQELESIDIIDMGVPVKMKSTTEQVHVLFFKNDKYLIATYDSSLNLQTTTNLGAGYYQPTDFIIDDNQITVVGNTRSRIIDAPNNYGGYNGFYDNLGSDIYLQTWDMGQSNSSGVDVALDPFTFTDTLTLLEDEYCGFNGLGAMSIQIDGIEVKVTNNGTATINNLELNAGNFPCAYICPTTITATYSYDNLDLGPGESTVLSFGDYQTFFMPFDSLYEFCIWASGVNDRLDDNFTDNKSCLLFTPGGLVDIDEKEQLSFDWSMAPNPANNILNVIANNPLPENSVVYIQNLVGQTVSQKNVEKGSNQVMFDISMLPGGTYLLKIVSGTQHNSRLWMKY